MKKLLTLLLTTVFAGSLGAQVIFSEDFDGIAGPTAGGAGTYSFPAGWLLRNVDARAPDAGVAFVNEAWERREDFNFAVVDSCAFSTSWYNPVGAADDWMWTPLMGPLPANCVLTWNAVAYDPLYPDGYEVRIMTAAQGPPTGGTGVMGNQVTNSTQVFSIGAENTAWTARSVNLNAYAGQAIYVAFRNNSNNQFLLLIDDVKVEVQVNHDAQVLAVDTVSPYTLVPLNQVSALPFVASIRNNGLQAVTNVRLKTDVLDATNTIVYTATSTATPSLASGATATFTAPAFTPSAVGSYTFRFAALINETDIVPGNDTNFWNAPFEVTDSTYARDNGSVVGGLGIGAGNGGYIGQSFTITTPTVMTSITAFYNLGYTGRQYAQVVYSTLPNLRPDAIIGGTDTLLYPDDSARVYTTALHAPLTLAPGTYMVAAIEFDSTVQLGNTTTIFTPGTCWVNWPTTPLGGWGNVEAFGPAFARSFVIRPNFGSVCPFNSPSVTTANNVLASCGGCDDGEATATGSGGTAPYTYIWSNGDASMVADSLLPGTYTVTITDANGCSDTASVLINFSTGVQTGSALLPIHLYPNPNNGQFTLVYAFESATDAHIEVTNLLGEVLYREQAQGWQQGTHEIALQGIAAGAYLVQITTVNGRQVLPLQLQ